MLLAGRRSKLLLQASLRRSSGLFSLVISLIPGCSALRAPATFKSIRNPLIFLFEKWLLTHAFGGPKGQNFSCRQACIEVPAFFPLVISLIPGCSALRASADLQKSIRNPLIFLRKMATYLCFWRAEGQNFSCRQACIEVPAFFPLVLCKQRLDLLKYLAVCLDLILISDHAYRASLKDRLRDRCKGADVFHSRV